MYKAVIDIGNTSVKFGLFRDKELLQINVASFWDEEEFKLFIKGYLVKQVIVSDVRYHDMPYREFLESQFQFYMLNLEVPLPIVNLYQTPETLGYDRICSVVGARQFHSESCILVISSGTCITYDLLNAKNEYMGGSISPGFDMRFRAMHEYTGKLPLVGIESDEEITEVLGKNTRDALISGAYFGLASEIDGMIDRYREYYPELVPVLTGGNWSLFAYNLKNKIFAHPNLVLYGLNSILDHYVKSA